MIYAIGDVHGMLDELKVLREKIMEHSKNRCGPHTIVMLGDYIDRGPDSKGVMDYLMTEPFDGFEHVILRGNHEQMLCDALNNHNVDMWLFNGGQETLQSFETVPGFAPDKKVFAPYVNWIKKLKVSHRINNFVFVHAGLNPDKAYEDNSHGDMMWIRGKFLNSDEEYLDRNNKPVMVIHGHTPTYFDPFSEVPENPVPVVRDNRINMDTGSVFTKLLTAVVINTDHVEGFISTKE